MRPAQIASFTLLIGLLASPLGVAPVLAADQGKADAKADAQAGAAAPSSGADTATSKGDSQQPGGCPSTTAGQATQPKSTACP